MSGSNGAGEVSNPLFVSTLAGMPGISGSTDGKGSAARFFTRLAWRHEGLSSSAQAKASGL